MQSVPEAHRRVSVQESLTLGPDAKLKVQRRGQADAVVDVNELTRLDYSNRVQVLTAARVLTAADSGKTFLLALAAGFPITLPVPAAGLDFEFIVSTPPTGGAYAIGTNGAADIIKGGVVEGDPTAAAASPSDDNADVVNFAANVALAGDRVRLISDGTSWFLSGQTRADGGVTTATS